MPTIQHEKVRVIEDDVESSISSNCDRDFHSESQINLTSVKKRPDTYIIDWKKSLKKKKGNSETRGKKTFINDVVE